MIKKEQRILTDLILLALLFFTPLQYTYSQAVGNLPGSCFPSTCGEFSPQGCWCDPACIAYQDCCSNYYTVCNKPKIISVAVEENESGTQVKITGLNFESTINSFSEVIIDNVPVTIINWGEQQIITEVPANWCGTVSIQVINQYEITSDLFAYDVAGPSIDAITLNPIGPNGQLEILGVNFSTAGNTVQIGGVTAQIVSEDQTQIVVGVPDVELACVTDIEVTIACGASTTGEYLGPAPLPTINSFSPSTPVPGDDLEILGTNFSSEGNTVRIGGFSAQVTSETQNRIVVTMPIVPPGCSTQIEVITACNLVTSNGTYPVLSAIVPSTLVPGSQVEIFGQNFSSEGNTVQIGGIIATPIGVQTLTKLTVEVPPELSACSVDFEVTTACGLSTSEIFEVSYLPPTIFAINPGALVPNSELVILGENFSPDDNVVKIGEISALVIDQDQAQLVVRVPNLEAACTAAIEVTTACGALGNSINFDVSYPPPTIESVTPGTLDPGGEIEIFGRNFPAGSTVRIGGVIASPVGTQTFTKLTVEVPSPLTGCATAIEVTTACGLISNPFNIPIAKPSPEIVGINLVQLAPGSPVEIFGNNFSEDNNVVRIGGIIATHLETQSLTKLVVEVPTELTACNAGIEVTTACNLVSNIINYAVINPNPIITGINLASLTPGEPVEIFGNNFSPDNNVVRIGGIIATHLETQTPSKLVIEVPTELTTCFAGIEVTTACNLVSNTINYAVINPNPIITGINLASLTPGEPVEIFGNNFSPDNNVVRIGGIIATHLETQSLPKLVVKVPTELTACNASIEVTTACNLVSNAINYAVINPNPIITGINLVSLTPGEPVEIFGNNFSPDNNVVRIGGIIATQLEPQTPSKLVVEVPAELTTCFAGIEVTTACDLVSNTANYTIINPNPQIVGINLLQLTPGDPVEISGNNFSEDNNIVRIGGIIATHLETQTITKLVVQVPLSLTACTASLEVTTECNLATDLVSYAVINPNPEIVGINLAQLTPGSPVEIFGNNFSPDNNVVRIGGIIATHLETQSLTKLVVKVPTELTACNASIEVTTACSLVSNTINYAVINPNPEIVGINLAQLTPGSPVEIFGNNFSPDNNVVRIGGIIATHLETQSLTRLVVEVPAELTACNADIEVTTACSLVSNTINYAVINPAPIITGINLIRITPGEPVEIIGNNFSPDDNVVKIGGIIASHLAPQTPTKLTVQVPAQLNVCSTDIQVTTACNLVSNFAIAQAVESIPPMISCPPNIVINNSIGQCDAVATFEISSTDNCPGESIVQTEGLASGSLFPIGTTTNTFVVTDASTNTASCSFDVTVNVDGEVEDSDSDGIIDLCDQCPGGDDTIDDNNDGIPDCLIDACALESLAPTGDLASAVYQASTSIQSNGIVQSGADVTFKAGQNVKLTAGFHALPGSVFSAVIEVCPVAITENNFLESLEGNIVVNAPAVSLDVFPNPFHSTLNIRFTVPNTGKIKLQIFNLQGQLIHSLHHGLIDTGEHQRSWSGDDQVGRPLAKGIYLIRLETMEEVVVKKVSFMR